MVAARFRSLHLWRRHDEISLLSVWIFGLLAVDSATWSRPGYQWDLIELEVYSGFRGRLID